MAVRDARLVGSGLSGKMAKKVKTESLPSVARDRALAYEQRQPKKEIPELVKQEGEQFNDDLYKQIAHLSRLSKITGMSYGNGLKIETMKALENKGFTWFIDHQFVEKFENAAALTKEKGNANCSVRQEVNSFNHTNVRFKGDLPDWVMDKIEDAFACGMDTITIHSHVPLPVKLELVDTDPVAVAWKGSPSITRNGKKGKFEMKDRQKQGVVIAIWQGEDEVDVV